MQGIGGGVWPTMVTPFRSDGEVDYEALAQLVEWYIEGGVHGLFAVCQSSEMFFLGLKERIEIARFVVEKVKGRVPVIASGHTSCVMEDQIEEVKRIYETGIDAFVLVTNRLAGQEESDDVWKRNTEKLLAANPEVSFGLYECPYPYKRLMSPDLLAWCESTDRFLFLKDTCCDLAEMQARLQALKGGRLQIFNANSATLLESLKLGVAGFSGIMANFHPELYVWLTENWREQPEKASELQDFLGVASAVEAQSYPLNAKYSFQLEGIEMRLQTRAMEQGKLQPQHKLVVEQVGRLSRKFRERIS
ncbi:dihydrodipicolinate synthase family protein [Paenibacillus sp. HB172176]|uniref:dihydrodipicolinate synthase family protein n=1 Tax=Paenibacillus sp. HB172176 TaxID=2493690 RepID=UPI00143CA9E1|nr:dihydrodipicolinate synthase family protein [Paenibacillus sp. HB172176]